EGGERYVLQRDADAPAAELVGPELLGGRDDGAAGRPFSFARERDGKADAIRAHTMRLLADPAGASDQTAGSGQINAAVELKDCVTQAPRGAIPRASYTQHFA